MLFLVAVMFLNKVPVQFRNIVVSKKLENFSSLLPFSISECLLVFFFFPAPSIRKQITDLGKAYSVVQFVVYIYLSFNP